MKKYMTPDVDILTMNEVLMQDMVVSVGDTAAPGEPTYAPSRSVIKVN